MPDNKILVSRPYYQGLGLGLETWWPRSWSWSRDLVTKVLVLVSRPGDQGLGLGLETWWPRSWSWSRDLMTKVLVLVSRPGDQGLGLGLESLSTVLIISLVLINSHIIADSIRFCSFCKIDNAN